MKIIAPLGNGYVDLHIQESEIVKITMHLSDEFSVMFFYTKPSCGLYIVDQLSLSQVNEKSPYFSPLSRNERQKKIILILDGYVTKEIKDAFLEIFKQYRLDEISFNDASEMLDQSTEIPNTKLLEKLHKKKLKIVEPNLEQEVEIVEDSMQTLLFYPQCRGGIAIRSYDYLCLGSELLTKEQQNKTHMFSTYFYIKLTTLIDDKRTLTAEGHQQIQSWTKNVNLFEKDFIIVPINERMHWFVVIICFPYLTGPHTMDTNQPIKLKSNQQKLKRIKPKHYETDSDSEYKTDKGQALKVPCMLIFDSLSQSTRTRAHLILRDYLTCEYRAKNPNATPRQYRESNMPKCTLKVPQQDNLTDCGLFLLQYVEQFFKEPLKDFRIPIKSLSKWFHQDIVTRKREDIANLIKTLIAREGSMHVKLPDIEFPTRDILKKADRQKEDLAIELFDTQESTSDEGSIYLPSESEDNVSKKASSSRRKKFKADKNNNKASKKK
ncbi:sentrin-specific protease 7-like [Chironomus tepperi]|uniref:sentrin-specific protease 7-like n=1 Tax=Chironomus tepperi TaxID=113505 RepID=UPI00391FA56C